MYDSALGRFYCIDPHSENYLSWTPYNYVANNPILLIDPDGQDWYQGEKGDIMWRNGSEKIEGYTNLGSHYTKKISKGVSVTYTQNQITSITFTALENEDWETLVYVDKNGKTKYGNCRTASEKMMSNGGVSSTRLGGFIVATGNANGVVTSASEVASKGIDYIDKTITNGNPVLVGVDYKPKQKHNLLKNGGDGMTDHFIVVRGKTDMLSNGKITKTIYSFFDSRTAKIKWGTSPKNTLPISNNLIKGKNKKYNYTVTSISKTVK